MKNNTEDNTAYFIYLIPLNNTAIKSMKFQSVKAVFE